MKQEIIAKYKNPVTFFENKKIHPLIEVFAQISFLKAIYRKGYIQENRGIDKTECESVAEHSFELAIFALLINDHFCLGLDELKIVIMSLIHDFGEIKDGDVTPLDNIAPEDKSEREKRNVFELFKKVKGGIKYLVIFNEFEKRETKEAKLVRLVDKFQMGMQAKFYNLLFGMNSDDFQQDVEAALMDTKLSSLFQELFR